MNVVLNSVYLVKLRVFVFHYSPDVVVKLFAIGIGNRFFGSFSVKNDVVEQLSVRTHKKLDLIELNLKTSEKNKNEFYPFGA